MRASIITYIIDRIYPNLNKEITGQTAQDALVYMAENLSTMDETTAVDNDLQAYKETNNTAISLMQGDIDTLQTNANTLTSRVDALEGLSSGDVERVILSEVSSINDHELTPDFGDYIEGLILVPASTETLTFKIQEGTTDILTQRSYDVQENTPYEIRFNRLFLSGENVKFVTDSVAGFDLIYKLYKNYYT